MFTTINRFFRGAFHSNLRGLGATTFLLAALAGWAAIYGSSIAFGVLALGLFAVFVWIGRMGMNDLETFKAERLGAAATRWIQSADTEDEANERERMVGAMGAAGALAAGAVAVNVDGIPMIGDSGVDIFGRAYGDLSTNPMDFDVPMSMDVATGFTLDASEAYGSPFHMDD